MSKRMHPVRCFTCNAPVVKHPSEINRARKYGRRLFCDKDCAGIARRTIDARTDTEKKLDKREYDMRYRARNRSLLKTKKAAYYQRTRNPEKERAKRRARMAWHVEYCRKYYSDPERKAAKVEYDSARRSRLQYGYWAECHRLYVELCREIRRLEPNKYERLKARGYEFNKAKNRRRACAIATN